MMEEVENGQGDHDEVESDIVASQTVEQVEVYKKWSRKLTCVSVARRDLESSSLVVLLMTRRSISVPRALSQQTPDEKCTGQRMFSTKDLFNFLFFRVY